MTGQARKVSWGFADWVVKHPMRKAGGESFGGFSQEDDMVPISVSDTS